LVLFLIIPITLGINVTQTPISGSDTSDGSFTLSNVTSDDGTRDSYTGSQGGYNETIYQEYVFSYALPDYENVTIDAVDITFNWLEKKIKAAKLEVFETASSFQDYSMDVATTDNTEITFTPDASDFIDSPSDANNLKIRFLAERPNGGGITSAVDFVQVSLDYSISVFAESDEYSYVRAGVTRTYGHRMRNDDVAANVSFSAVSSQGWTTRVYSDNNSNGVYDGGDVEITAPVSMAAYEEKHILVQVDIPGGTAGGTVDSTVLTMTNAGTSSFATITDTTNVTDLLTVIETDMAADYSVAHTATYAHIVFNSSASADTINLTAVSDQSFTTRIYLDADMDGVKDDSTIISQVSLAADSQTGIVVEIDLSTQFIFTIDVTTVTATGSTDSDTAVDTTNINPEDVIVDGVRDSLYTSNIAFHQFFNYGPDVSLSSGEVYWMVYDGRIYVFYIQAARVNDNTYGTNLHSTWTHHSFEDLVGSDHTEFIFYDASGDIRLQFFSDYVDEVAESPQYPAGYHCMGFAGGDGLMVVNNSPTYDDSQLANAMEFECSLAYSVNHYATYSRGQPIVNCSGVDIDLTVDSAPIDEYYNVTCANADEFKPFYAIEFSVPVDAFPQEPIVNIVARAHNSPSKVQEDSTQIPAVSSIGDRVWYDWNANGLQDTEETQGIANVLLYLYYDRNGDGTFSSEEFIESTYTNSDGYYMFSGLSAGDYQVDVVDVTIPSGFTLTTSYDPYILSDTISGAARGSLSEDEDCLTADFGYDAPLAIIGDFVWFDTDQDGVQDNGEMGIGGVTLDLIDTSTSLVIATTTTTPNGWYLFTGLAAGTYQVDVTDTNSVLTGYTHSSGPESQPDPSYEIVLAAEDVDLDADFGYYTAIYGSLGDTVFYDAGWDTNFTVGTDSGFPNVTLNIWEDSNSNNRLDVQDNFIGGTTTDNTTSVEGNYLFTGLPVSTTGITYIVRVIDSNNVLDGFSKFYPGAYLTSTLTTAAPIDLTVDFPYIATGFIGDFIWNDLDNDGVQDALEPGIDGVTVQLDQGGILYAEAISDFRGYYSFGNLRPNFTYDVSITDTGGVLTGWTASPQGQGTSTTDSNDPTGTSTTLDSTNYFADTSIDFGYYNNALTFGSIGDYIWNDSDGDGIQDEGSGFGFNGITLELRDSEGHILQTTTTSGDGDYTFVGLPTSAAGIAYQVVVTDIDGILSGYTMTTDPAVLNVTLTTTTPDVDTADAGYLRPTRVWLSEFDVFEYQGDTVVQWETGSEFGTVGFNLSRFDPVAGKYLQVNEVLLPASLTQQGGVYRIVDKSASPSGSYVYRLTEITHSGELKYGPFTGTIGSISKFTTSAGLSLPEMKSHYSIIPHQRSAERCRLITRDSETNGRKGFRVTGKSSQNMNISIEESGFYKLDVADIASVTGCNVRDVSTHIRNGNIKLTCMGETVPWVRMGSEVSITEGGIGFYAESRIDNYTDTNIYILSFAEGQIMSTVASGQGTHSTSGDSFLESVHMEENFYPLTAMFDNPGDDYWVWDYLIGDGEQKIFPLDVYNPVTTGIAELTLTLRGASDSGSDPDHHVEINVNNQFLGEGSWNGLDEFIISFEFSSEYLLDADNQIELTGILDAGVPYSFFYVNSFDLTYTRNYLAVDDQILIRGDNNDAITIGNFSNPDILVFKVTNPAQIWQDLVQLTDLTIEEESGLDTYSVSFQPEQPDTEYFTVTRTAAKTPTAMNPGKIPYLKETGNSVDYLIITDTNLLIDAQVFADYQLNRGLTSMVVDVADIYDEFNYGISNPGAIRLFIDYAYSQWISSPSYVALLGKGTYDYKDLRGFGDNIVPTKMVGTPFGLCPSDTWYADIRNDDGVPEIAIGRIPVITGQEINDYVIKMSNYDSVISEWSSHVLLTADDPDEGGSFTADSDFIASLLPPEITYEKIYLTEYTPEIARQKAIDGINNGAVLFNYIGHGAMHTLANEGILRTQDVPALANGDLLPVMLGMTCLVGNFAVPGYDALSELLVLRNDGGMIAVWAPTGLALNSFNIILDEKFIQTVFETDEKVLGNAINYAMTEYRRVEDTEFILRIFNFQGDPALELP